MITTYTKLCNMVTPEDLAENYDVDAVGEMFFGKCIELPSCFKKGDLPALERGRERH